MGVGHQCVGWTVRSYVLRYVKSNRDGIGVKVWFQLGDTILHREVKSGSSCLSQNPFRLHVGLGTEESVERIVIDWQNGVQDVLENVRCYQWLTIKVGNTNFNYFYSILP